MKQQKVVAFLCGSTKAEDVDSVDTEEKVNDKCEFDIKKRESEEEL